MAKLSWVFLQARYYLICVLVPSKTVPVSAFPRRSILNWRKSKCTVVSTDHDGDVGQKFHCFAVALCHSVYGSTD